MWEEAATALISDTGDTADGAGLNALYDGHRIGSIIHPAGLQVPFSKANPPLGARFNLEGRINILDDAPIRVHLGVYALIPVKDGITWTLEAFQSLEAERQLEVR